MKKLLIASAMVLLPALSSAAALEQFQKFMTQTQVAMGDFEQRTGKAGAPGKLSSGQFVFSRPGKFTWNYMKPYEQLLQSDGKKLYIYDKDLNQVTVRKLGDALGSSPAAILFGSNDLGKTFNLKDDGAANGVEWVLATPKNKESTFERIRIGLQYGKPVAMELHDAFGQVTELTFKNFDNTGSLTGSYFEFKLPKGADVLEQ